MQFQVLRLVRRVRVLELDARIVNLSPGGSRDRLLRLGDGFDDGLRSGALDRADTVDGLQLLDVEGRKLYKVDRHDGGACACTSQLDKAVLGPGGSRRLWASFQAPLPRSARST